MKVTHQKNVYYVDLSKNLYRGYVETSISRDPIDKYITYKSAFLEIEEVLVINSMMKLDFEYFSTKNTKGKLKVSKGLKTATPLENKDLVNEKTQECDLFGSKRNLQHFISPEQQKSDEEKSKLEYKLEKRVSECNDAFKVKIPDEVIDKELKIRIIFRPVDNNPAILWYKPVSDNDKHKEVVASNYNRNSSCIAPYIDLIAEFELHYIIPNTEDVKVVSSGAFKSIKEEEKTIIYLYHALAHPKNFIFTVGTYDQSDIFNDNDKRRILTPHSIEIGQMEVVSDLQALIKYIEGFTKTTELLVCSIVFTLIDVEALVAKNMIVLRYTYFPSSKDIEMAYVLKKVLSECLSQQVYYFMNWGLYDAWIYVGLSGYLSDYCIRYLLGNNEFLSNYFEDKEFVVAGDVLEPPLFYTLRKENEISTEFFKKKSRLVFHAMETQLSFAFLQKISDEIIEARRISSDIEKHECEPERCSKDGSCALKILNSHTDLKKCFTQRFIKIVKDSTGKDLRAFFDFYVFKAGLMKVKLEFQINKKKNSVKVNAAYTPTSKLPGCNKRILTNLGIKFYELEGNFEHTVIFDNENVFMYHMRTKKKKKDEDEDVMPLLYIRADPKRVNLFEYDVEQPDYMQIEQLQDKSVIGQFEAIQCLGIKPSLSSCEALERMLDSTHMFYKVRIKIAYILRSIKIEGYDGLQRIIQHFIRNRCVPNSTVLKSNEFGLIPYFIQKHLVKSISSIDFNNENAIVDSRIALAFLENILKFNDNSLSQYEDSWYIAAVINLFSTHCCFLTCYKSPVSETERIFNNYKTKDADDLLSSILPLFPNVDSSRKQPSISPSMISKCICEIERFRISDMVFSSNNNIITRACLLSYTRMAFYNKIKICRESLEGLAKYPNILSVRLIAIEGLLLLFSDSLKTVLSLLVSEVVFTIHQVLEIILKLLLLDLKVHFSDTDEYDVSLTDRMRAELELQSDTLLFLYQRSFFHTGITDLIRKIISIIENKQVTLGTYREIVIKNYNCAWEESNRQVILKMPSTTKRLKVSNLNNLRLAIFETDWTLRLPRIKNYKSKLQKEPVKRNLKIRIAPNKFLVKHLSNYLIRLNISGTSLEPREQDVSFIIAKKYFENPGTEIVDDYINKNKSTGFFPWTPHTANQILDFVRAKKMQCNEAFREIEKGLIFVLSYNLITSKMYQTAKSLYSYVEQHFLSNAFILEKITRLTPELRKKCADCLDKLQENPKYEVFLLPVDSSELKNYVDIVRVPVSFYSIHTNLPNYQSLEAFIVHLERIYINCLNYNDSRSLIAQTAIELKNDIDSFKSNLVAERVNSLEIIKEIICSQNIENLLDQLLEKLSNIKTWGKIETELLLLKKKYSRSSHNGKIMITAVKNIREQFKNWFLFDGIRALVVSE
ncbi:Transcription initiation factor TFIID subunit 2 [Glugoides intestinalis]